MQKGSYSLLIELKSSEKIRIGALGTKKFQKGYYAYNGSAFGPGGFKRVERHKQNLEKCNKKHWHIDYFLSNNKTKYKGVIKSNSDIECECSQIKRKNITKVSNFGSSDCKCDSHLLYSRKLSLLRKKLLEKHNTLSERTTKEWKN